MALVPHFRSVRIWKRSAKKRPRPAWQDFVAGTGEGKDAYAIAAQNEKKFARAYLEAVRGILDEKRQKSFSEAWASGSISSVMSAIPFMSDGSISADDPIWGAFVQRLRSAYYNIMRETSDATATAIGKRFGKKIIFSYIHKAAGKLMVNTVPVNPRSLKWIDERALELVREGMAKPQREVVRQIIEDGFSKGLRPSEAYDSIKQNIGLTSREYNAVENRRLLMEEKGFQPGDIRDGVDAYREELHEKRAERIARTETMYAESQGRLESWKAATEAGVLPKVVRQWVAPPPGPSPNKPCSICLSLDGLTTTLDGVYESSELDEPVEGPPAHPYCLPGDVEICASGVEAVMQHRFDGDLVILRAAGGQRLPCTPNHPILTHRGWLPAHSVHVGDKVFCGSNSRSVASTFFSNEQHNMPPQSEIAANFFRQSFGATSRRVPVASEDFHGDVVDGDIAVIKTDRFLRHGPTTEAMKQFGKIQLLLGRVYLSFFVRYRPLAFFVAGLDAATNSRVRGLCALHATGLSDFFHENFQRLASVSRLDSRKKKQSTNLRSGDAPGFGERLLAHSGEIVLCDVLNVDVQRFSGHVYNLQCAQGYYVAGGIVNHNCRCTETIVEAEPIEAEEV